MLKAPLFVAMYTALRTIPGIPIPTWRVANLLLVCQFLLLRTKLRLSGTCFLLTTLTFAIYLFVQCIIINDTSSYNAASALSMLALFGLSFFVYSNAAENGFAIIKTIRSSAATLFIYQVFQIAMFVFDRKQLMFILNDADTLERSNAIRLVGMMFGAQGFMAESGHAALFVGPLAMSLLLFNHYEITKTPTLYTYIFIASLLSTLSGGGILQLVLLLMMLILLQKSLARRVWCLASVCAASCLLFLLLGDYVSLLVYKFQAINSGNDSRLNSATIYLNVFYENVFLGVGPAQVRDIVADPNILIPILLASYGLLGASFLSLIVIVLPFLFLLKSKTKLFIIPILAIFLQLGFAYGTISWPFVWVNFSLALFGISFGINRSENAVAPEASDLKFCKPQYGGVC